MAEVTTSKALSDSAKLRIIRKATTEANQRYGIGGRVKARQPRPITLAKTVDKAAPDRQVRR